MVFDSANSCLVCLDEAIKSLHESDCKRSSSSNKIMEYTSLVCKWVNLFCHLFIFCIFRASFKSFIHVKRSIFHTRKRCSSNSLSEVKFRYFALEFKLEV